MLCWIIGRLKLLSPKPFGWQGVGGLVPTGWLPGFWNDAVVLWAPAMLSSHIRHPSCFPHLAERTSEVLK